MAAVPAPPPTDAPLLSPEEQRAFLLQRRMERSRIPPIFRAKTLESFDTRDKARRDIRQQARQYVDSFGLHGEDRRGPGLLLYGATGSGKTHILCAVLRELLLKGHDALFYSVPTLFKDLRATFDGNEDLDEDDLLEGVAHVEILAFDDLGAEKTSDWVLDRLYLIVNQRYEKCLPTLITTNHPWPEDLERAVGPRIASRLAEMCQVIGPFPEEDWRMRSAGLKRRLS